MSKSSYRPIVINGKDWKWKVGSWIVSIRGPNKEHFKVTKQELTGIEDTERAEWKGYLHITPRQVAAYIKRRTGVFDPVPSLRDVFFEKMSATYLGGSLTISAFGESFIYNVGSESNTDEEDFWIALNYIKYKNSSCAFYNKAIEIASKYDKLPEKKLVALALLKSEPPSSPETIEYIL